MRVVFCVLDSLPPGMINAEDTPNLWAQAQAGGVAPDGGRSLDVSVTYSNHAAFVTGVPPIQTGLWGNRAWNGDGFINTWDAGPRATTLFDRCRRAGKRSVAIVGDHKLITTMGADVADHSWPPHGELPDGTPLDPYGYAADDAVVGQIAAADLTASFVFLHLNEPDTTLHVHGPESPEAVAQIRRSDASYGQVVDALKPDWDDTILFTVSDHQQTQITVDECVNLRGHAKKHGWAVEVSHEGTAAVVIGQIELEAITSFPGVAGAESAGPDTILAWAEPGKMFGSHLAPTRGNHGCPASRPQVAIASGGHPQVAHLAEMVRSEPVGTLTWAPLIADLLDLDANVGG